MFTVRSVLRANRFTAAFTTILMTVVVIATFMPATGARAQSAPYNRGIDGACTSDAQAFDPFIDAPTGSHTHAVRCIAHFGIGHGSVDTAGHYRYEPKRSVTREQMASFVARAMNRVDGFNLPVSPSRGFPDSTGEHGRNIDRLAAAGIVEGDTNGQFDRSGTVTREQMASFVSRAIEHIADESLSATDAFDNNNIAGAHEDNVSKLAGVGIVQGRSNSNFEPRAAVTREEMASFLARALDYLASRDHGLTPAPPQDLQRAAEGIHWPNCGRVTSEYGPRWGRIHHGIDVAAPAGTPIYASRSGQVTFVGWDGGYGNIVRIDHGNGISTAYAHMVRFDTSVGAEVNRGDRIGFVGTTGNSTGPHVHFEIRYNGQSVNPREHLSGSPSHC